MHFRTIVAAATLLLVTFAAHAGEGPATVVAEKQDFAKEIERTGTLVPSDSAEIELVFRAFSGELRLTRVLPHGTPVRRGDVIARIDPEPLEKQMHQAELDLRTTELNHRNTIERHEIDEESAQVALEKSRVVLERARRDFEGFEKHELDFRERSREQSRGYQKDNIEDQKDELAQLEKMYGEDELTDETEEIVLKRSRRQLARTMTSMALSMDREKFDREYRHPVEHETKREAVADRARSLEQLRRRQAMDRRSRRDAAARSEDGLRQKREKIEKLRGDLELLTIRAPRGGVLLHGGADSYKPGATAARHEVGGRAQARTELFTVAEPGRFDVALDIPESNIASVDSGLAARVSALSAPGSEWVGSIRVERYPNPKSAGRPENTYDASVHLDKSLPGLVAGMRAKVRLTVEKHDGVIVLPATAVRGAGSDAHCWVADGDDFKKVSVEVGPSENGNVVVTSGIEAGQRVLLTEPAK